MNLDELREFFGRDEFAKAQGITIDEVTEGEAICSMRVLPTHLNATGGVQGGVMFTLADYCMAVYMNSKDVRRVSLSCSIQYIRSPRGKRLTAVCRPVGEGRTVGHYEVDIMDGDVTVAKMIGQGFRIG